MTESMAFLAAAWALYATMLALERPTVPRQLWLLAAIGVAFLTRSQFGVLYVGWLVALGLHWWISPSTRPRGRADWRRLWPSALPLARGRRVPRGTARRRLLAARLARRLLGAVARLRPVRRREVGRVPPRRHRDLPRRDPARRRADRPDAARAARTSGLAPSTPRSRRSSSRPTRRASSSSPPSRARRGATTACTTATPSTSSRSG